MLTACPDSSQGGLAIEDTPPTQMDYWLKPKPRATLRAMELSHADRRLPTERRASSDRRRVVTVVVQERRSGVERRAQPERRAPESAGEHIRNALQLLTNVAESGTLDEESLRDLDAAMFRLRFALDRLEART